MKVRARTPQTGESADATPGGTPSPARFAGAAVALVVASWLPVLVGATTRAAAGWIVAAILAAVAAWLSTRLSLGVLVSGLVLSSAFVPSGLVTDATHYMPVAVTGGALALRMALDARRSGIRELPPAPIAVTVGLYLGWAAITTVTSIDRRTSLVYLAGLVLVCTLAFWLIPAALTRGERERLLASIGVLGIVVAVSVYFVSIFGAFDVFGRPVGLYREVALTVGGRATSLHFGFSSGVSLAPLEASVLMAVGVISMFGWSSGRSGRTLGLAWAANVFMIPAILLTLDRSAWLAVIVGAGAFVVLGLAAKLRVRMALIVGAFFAAVFLLVFVNAVGAIAVTNGCTSNCTINNNPQNNIRGGTGLSGREFLWKASLEAIKHRPIQGYGAGNVVPAIAPYLTSDATQAGYNLGGYTSHSTWFRTAVELGVPGLLLLVSILLAAAWLFLRRGFDSGRHPDPAAIAFAAIVAGLLPAMTFETFLLGGVTFSSLVLTVATGLLVVPEAGRSPEGMLPG